MPVGDVRVPRARQQTVSPSIPSATFGAGTARALGQLANNIGAAGQDIQRIEEMQRRREERSEDFDVQRRWVEYNGQQDLLQAERINTATRDGTHVGITDRINDEIEASNAEFLATVPERLRDEYAVRLEGLINSKVSGAFNYEYEQGNRAFLNQTGQTISSLATQMRQGSLSADRAIQEIDALIVMSDLPDITQQELRVGAISQFRSIEFENEIRVARAGGGTVRPATGEDIVAAGILPHERGFLNAVSRRESGDRYNVRYGGEAGPQTFDSFEDHPRVFVRRPDGRLSSAAGRYQFTATTWDMVAAQLGLTSFSPENQDRAAIHLARQRYNAQRAGGLTFDQALQSGDRRTILTVRDSLAETWEAFATMSDDEFINITQGAAGLAGGGTGSAMFPDVWNDERFAMLPYDVRVDLANAGATAEQQRIDDELEALREQHQAALDAANLGAIQGNLSEADVDRLIQDGTLQTAGEIRSFQEFARRGAEGVQGAAAVGRQLTDPNYVFTGTDMRNLNEYVGDAGLQSLGARDENYVNGVFTPLVSRTGIMPSNATRVLSQQLASGNPQQAGFALGVLGDLYTQNPEIIERAEGLSRQQRDQVAVFAANRPFTTPEEALELIQQAQDPNQQQANEILAEEARDAFADISDRSLLNAFDPSIFVRGADFPGTRSQELAFRSQAQSLFVQGWQLFRGDETRARDYMNSRLALEWGPSDIGGAGRRLIRNGPEKYYPQVSGAHDWIDFNVREELGLGADAEFQLVADDQTTFEGRQFAAGEGEFNASYMVAVRDEDGNFRLQLRDDGRPQRLAFEISELQNQLNLAQAEDSNLDARIAQLNREWVLTEGVGEEADRLQAEITKLFEQKRALRNNAGVASGNAETPFMPTTRADRRIEENREQQDRINRIIRGALQPTSTVSRAEFEGYQEELRQLEEEAEMLEREARGQADG